MFRKKPTILSFVALFSLFSLLTDGQTSEDKTSKMSSLFDYDGMRPNNPENLYDRIFLKDSTYFYRARSEGMSFDLTGKRTFEYNLQGQLMVENDFQHNNESWNKSGRTIFNYNQNGSVEYRVDQIWDIHESTFENTQRTFFYRAFGGMLSSEIIERYDNGKWKRNLKNEFSYNAFRKVTEEVRHSWSDITFAWLPLERVLFDYNDRQNLTSEIVQVWVDSLGVWVNKSYKGYEYNGDDFLINLTKSSWNPNLGEWIELSFQSLSYTSLGQVENSSFFINEDSSQKEEERVSASYDSNGNLNMTLFKEWDPEANDWNTYEKHQHFWGQYLIGNHSGNKEEVSCIYANPHVIGLPWYCESLVKDEAYNLSVYDQNGVLHHAQQIIGGSTFRLNTSLESGLYVVVITGGLTVHSEKVLIRK